VHIGTVATLGAADEGVVGTHLREAHLVGWTTVSTEWRLDHDFKVIFRIIAKSVNQISRAVLGRMPGRKTPLLVGQWNPL